jgi:hypothetical protein
MGKISTGELRDAVERAGLPPEVFERIRAALATAPEISPRFETAHVSYYLGAMLIIGAMGWFITDAWDRLSGLALSGIAIAYGVVFGVVGYRLFQRASTKIPGGVLVAAAVCMTPMAVYGVERWLGWWPANDPGSYTRFHPRIHASWVAMEIATIILAAIAVKMVRFPFVTAPAAYAAWYLTMDATALIFGAQWNFRQECWISVSFGLAMMLAGYLLDGEPDLDFSFWFYLFGVLAFTGGLTLMGNGNQLGKAVYCLIHLGMMVLSILLQRKVLLIFGAIGVFVYLMGEAQGYFRNSLGFTVSLTLIGILFIAAGIAYKRNEAALEARLAPLIPSKVRHRHAKLA